MAAWPYHAPSTRKKKHRKIVFNYPTNATCAQSQHKPQGRPLRVVLCPSVLCRPPTPSSSSPGLYTPEPATCLECMMLCVSQPAPMMTKLRRLPQPHTATHTYAHTPCILTCCTLDIHMHTHTCCAATAKRSLTTPRLRCGQPATTAKAHPSRTPGGSRRSQGDTQGGACSVV